MIPAAKVTRAYEAWWSFACERQRIYYRRLRGEPAPWTDDQTLFRYRFTNAYRAADRVSQYLIKEVIYQDVSPQDPNEVVFRILLFKVFNRIETWRALVGEMGSLVLADDPFARIGKILADRLAAGQQVYSAAYIMPVSRTGGPDLRKHEIHLDLLQAMMADRLGERLADTRTMQEGFDLLRAYPLIGDFLAYQYITDINYSNVVDYSESEFVAAGPGAREGLRKCFADAGGRSNGYLIRMMMDLQEEEFERLGLHFDSLFGRPLQLIDCQNLFCEVAKYTRVRFPALTPPGGRSRIKQTYRPTGDIAAPFFPPKWGINETVNALLGPANDDAPIDLEGYQRQAARTSFHSPVRGGDAITTPILGVIGEAGEVVSELKKRAREGAAYSAFPDRLGEELGDLLWYVADLADRCGIRLTDLDLVDDGEGARRATADEGDWIRAALSLTEATGHVSSAYQALRLGGASNRQFSSDLSSSLASLLADLKILIRLHGLSLAEIADGNLRKVEHRWARPRDGAPIHQRKWPESEQLPSHFDACLADRWGRVSISFSIDGESIPSVPDSLTDNAYDPDGYRFHDIFHMAYAAVLGWSPVTRRLLRRKRKSDPRVDEVEDGGRAVVIEEGIAAMVFAYAGQHRMLEGVETVDYSVLRTIREMTRHLEVGSRTAGEWQEAIVQGFDAWRAVRDARGGRVRVDQSERKICFLGSERQVRADPELPFSYEEVK